MAAFRYLCIDKNVPLLGEGYPDPVSAWMRGRVLFRSPLSYWVKEEGKGKQWYQVDENKKYFFYQLDAALVFNIGFRTLKRQIPSRLAVCAVFLNHLIEHPNPFSVFMDMLYKDSNYLDRPCESNKTCELLCLKIVGKRRRFASDRGGHFAYFAKIAEVFFGTETKAAIYQQALNDAPLLVERAPYLTQAIVDLALASSADEISEIYSAFFSAWENDGEPITFTVHSQGLSY